MLVLDHLDTLAGYWEKVPGDARHKIRGLVFSILCMLDGVSGSMPGFRVFPSCDPSDPDYLKAEGENWHPPNEDCGPLLNEITTVMLHEEWSKRP